MEVVLGWYGGLAVRSEQWWPLWSCHDQEYHWYGVTDDYGDIVAVTPYVNIDRRA